MCRDDFSFYCNNYVIFHYNGNVIICYIQWILLALDFKNRHRNVFLRDIIIKYTMLNNAFIFKVLISRWPCWLITLQIKHWSHDFDSRGVSQPNDTDVGFFLQNKTCASEILAKYVKFWTFSCSFFSSHLGFSHKYHIPAFVNTWTNIKM